MADRRGPFSLVEEVLEEARHGRLVVLLDDESRENEGDLIVPAQMATPEAINFMAKYGRGLICLALTRQRVDDLGLALMAKNNESRLQTAFTVSIEAKEGVTTGISTADRAHTIATAIDPAKGRDDIACPGHVFPLVARDGGVLERAGHTEAAVDIARLAGLNASGVICEVMNDDGTMARLPDLISFAQRHGLKMATIADLISYRLGSENFVRREIETEFESRFGGAFRMVVFSNTLEYAEHVALIKGEVNSSEPVLVRMHALDVLDDVLGGAKRRHGGELAQAMRIIGEAGRGVVVLIREPRPTILSECLRARSVASKRPASGQSDSELRAYGIGAQILRDLGIRDMILLSNRTRTVIGLEGYGLRIIGERPIPLPED